MTAILNPKANIINTVRLQANGRAAVAMELGEYSQLAAISQHCVSPPVNALQPTESSRVKALTY